MTVRSPVPCALQRRKQRTEGVVEAVWRPGEVLLVTMRGHQDAATIGRLVTLVRSRLEERRVRAVIFDAIGVDGFSPDLRQAGVELLGVVRSSGSRAAWPR